MTQNIAAWVTVTLPSRYGSFANRQKSCSTHPRRRLRTRVTPPTALAKRSSSDPDVTTLEAAVISAGLQLARSCDFRIERYLSKTEMFATARAAAEQLENTSRGFSGRSALRKPMIGKWNLLFTDSTAVIKNKGSITGLGSLPGAQCSRVQVILEAGGRAQTVESVTVFGLLNSENSLIGKWKLTGKTGQRLEVTYAEAILMGKSKIRADSKAVLDTTYCGETVRIGRSPSGDLYVFERAKSIVPLPDEDDK